MSFSLGILEKSEGWRNYKMSRLELYETSLPVDQGIEGVPVELFNFASQQLEESTQVILEFFNSDIVWEISYQLC